MYPDNASGIDNKTDRNHNLVNHTIRYAYNQIVVDFSALGNIHEEAMF